MADLGIIPFADAPLVRGLRLIGATPSLIVAVQPEQGEMRVETASPPHLLATVERNAAWDATAVGDRIAIVSSRSGSAISGLLWEIVGQSGQRTVNRHDRYGVFGVPRYIRHDTRHLVPITSVAVGGGPSRLVLFPPEPDDGYGALQVLPMPIPGDVVDARILHWGGGYLLAVKTSLPGAGRPQHAGADSETILPGRLHCIRLNDAMQPDGPAWQPLSAQTVFEFDVDTVGDGWAVLATIASGAVLIATARASVPPKVTDLRSEVPLASPAILATGGRLHFAMLRAAGSPAAAIMQSEVAASP
jgi:hypothetical protein